MKLTDPLGHALSSERGRTMGTLTAAVEEDLDFSPAGHIYATHGLHAFAARCPPPLVNWAIRRFTSPGDVVLDPMAGSGTTLVEACLLGRRAYGVEIDPLARLVAKAKATPVDPEAIDDASALITQKMARDGLDDSWRPQLPGWDRWFRPDVAKDLSKLRDAISQIAGCPDLQDLLWVVFSSLIVARTSVANAYDLVHSRHHYRPWKESPDVPRRFADRLKGIRRMMANYRTRLLESNGSTDVRVEMVGEDARNLPLEDGQIDLVFTSPPYWALLHWSPSRVIGQTPAHEISPMPSPPPGAKVGLRRVPVPARGHHPGGALVPAVRPVLPGRRGAPRRARHPCRPREHLPVGPAVRAGVRGGGSGPSARHRGSLARR